MHTPPDGPSENSEGTPASSDMRSNVARSVENLLSQNKSNALGRNRNNEAYASIISPEKLEAIGTYLNVQQIKALYGEILHDDALSIEKIEAIGKYLSPEKITAFDSFYLTQEWASPNFIQAMGEYLSPEQIKTMYYTPQYLDTVKAEDRELDKNIIRAIGVCLSPQQIKAIGPRNLYRRNNLETLIYFISHSLSLKEIHLLKGYNIVRMGEKKLEAILKYLSHTMIQELGPGYLCDVSIENLIAIGRHWSPSILKKVCGTTQAGSYLEHFERSNGEKLTPEVIERLAQ